MTTTVARAQSPPRSRRHERDQGQEEPTDGHPVADAPVAAPAPQSAAGPSPFTPIAEYGFLSNCHTGALVAPDGTIDWLCVPRFDSPSVFGVAARPGAGAFRLGPFGINVPSRRGLRARHQRPGDGVEDAIGMGVVRDALTMGPRRGEDTVTPHTRPPTDEDADHMLVRTVKCIGGSVEIELVCEPGFDYGRVTASGRSARTATGPTQAAPGRRSGCRPTCCSGSRATALGPDTSCAKARGCSARSRGLRRRLCRPPSTRPTPLTHDDHSVLAQLAGAGADPRPRVPAADPALRADDQGPHVHADRGHGCGADHVAPGDARR